MKPIRGPLRDTGDRGFIIVAVLWILGALATLAAIYSIYVTNTAAGLGINDDRVQMESLVSAALELTAYQLTAAGEKAAPTRGAFAFRLGRANVAADFRPEASRIDLNKAPKELLAGLFAGLGASASDADYYADRIIGWRTKGTADGADPETAAYRTAGLSYGPRRGPFANVGELWLVFGLPAALVERAVPHLTVFSGQAQINALSAAPEVLAALPGMTPDRLYAVLAQRGAGAQNAQLMVGLLGPTGSSASTDDGKTTRVTVRVDFDNGRRVGAEAVILLTEDADEPFRVLSWHDDFDGPG